MPGLSLGLGLGLSSGGIPRNLWGIIRNGDVTGATYWTPVSGETGKITFTDGKMVATGITSSTAVENSASEATVVDAYYEITYTVTEFTGTGSGCRPSIGGVNGTNRTTPGTYTETFGPTVNTNPPRMAFLNGFTGKVDNISCVQTLGPNIVQNSGYDDATGWTFSGSAPPTISTGKLRAGGGEGEANTTASSAMSVGAKYRVAYTVDSRSAGGVVVRLAVLNATVLTVTTGTFSEDITISAVSGAGNNVRVNFTDPSDAVIDNLSVRAVL